MWSLKCDIGPPICRFSPAEMAHLDPKCRHFMRFPYSRVWGVLYGKMQECRHPCLECDILCQWMWHFGCLMSHLLRCCVQCHILLCDVTFLGNPWTYVSFQAVNCKLQGCDMFRVYNVASSRLECSIPSLWCHLHCAEMRHYDIAKATFLGPCDATFI